MAKCSPRKFEVPLCQKCGSPFVVYEKNNKLEGRLNMAYNTGGSAIEPVNAFYAADTLKLLLQTVPLDIDNEVYEEAAHIVRN